MLRTIQIIRDNVFPTVLGTGGIILNYYQINTLLKGDIYFVIWHVHLIALLIGMAMIFFAAISMTLTKKNGKKRATLSFGITLLITCIIGGLQIAIIQTNQYASKESLKQKIIQFHDRLAKDTALIDSSERILINVFCYEAASVQILEKNILKSMKGNYSSIHDIPENELIHNFIKTITKEGSTILKDSSLQSFLIDKELHDFLLNESKNTDLTLASRIKSFCQLQEIIHASILYFNNPTVKHIHQQLRRVEKELEDSIENVRRRIVLTKNQEKVIKEKLITWQKNYFKVTINDTSITELYRQKALHLMPPSNKDSTVAVFDLFCMDEHYYFLSKAYDNSLPISERFDAISFSDVFIYVYSNLKDELSRQQQDRLAEIELLNTTINPLILRKLYNQWQGVNIDNQN